MAATRRASWATLPLQSWAETSVRHSHRTLSSGGASTSEPEVGRPLMTPDEVRRYQDALRRREHRERESVRRTEGKLAVAALTSEQDHSS